MSSSASVQSDAKMFVHNGRVFAQILRRAVMANLTRIEDHDPMARSACCPLPLLRRSFRRGKSV